MKGPGLALLRATAILGWLASAWLSVTMYALATQAAQSVLDMPLASQVFFLAPVLAVVGVSGLLFIKQRSPWIEIAPLSALLYQAVCFAVPLI